MRVGKSVAYLSLLPLQCFLRVFLGFFGIFRIVIKQKFLIKSTNTIFLVTFNSYLFRLFAKPLNLYFLELWILSLYLGCFGDNHEQLIIVTLIFHRHFSFPLRWNIFLFLFTVFLIEYLLLIVVSISAYPFFFFLLFWFFQNNGSLLGELIFFLDRVWIKQRRFHRPDSLKTKMHPMQLSFLVPLLKLMCIEMIPDLFIWGKSKVLLNFFNV